MLPLCGFGRILLHESMLFIPNYCSHLYNQLITMQSYLHVTLFLLTGLTVFWVTWTKSNWHILKIPVCNYNIFILWICSSTKTEVRSEIELWNGPWENSVHFIKTAILNGNDSMNILCTCKIQVITHVLQQKQIQKTKQICQNHKGIFGKIP